MGSAAFEERSERAGPLCQMMLVELWKSRGVVIV